MIVEWKVVDSDKEGERHPEAQYRTTDLGAILEEVERKQRLVAHTVLPEKECREEDTEEDEKDNDESALPGFRVSSPLQRENEKGHESEAEHRPDPVERHPALYERLLSELCVLES